MNMFFWRRFAIAILAVSLTTISGCATTGATDDRDPYEGFNRSVHNFNKAVDKAVFNPIGSVYRAITPDVVDKSLSNFFSNLNDISVVANDIMQFKFGQALSDAARFIFNSTIGILGLFDVATAMNLPKHDEDFGQTLAVWGFGPGPYLVVPFLGPSTLRDSTRVLVDGGLLNPIFYLNDDMLRAGLLSLNYIDFKSDLFVAGNLVEDASLDEYEFIKNAYFERREGQIRDSEFPEYEE